MSIEQTPGELIRQAQQSLCSELLQLIESFELVQGVAVLQVLVEIKESSPPGSLDRPKNKRTVTISLEL